LHKSNFYLKIHFYVPNAIAAIKLYLRRTLVLSVHYSAWCSLFHYCITYSVGKGKPEFGTGCPFA